MNEALVCFVLCSCKMVIPIEGEVRYCKGLKNENKSKSLTETAKNFCFEGRFM